jgi:histidinol dehydrogenase
MTTRKIVWDREISAASVAELLPRAGQDAASVSKTVEQIIGEVRDRGSNHVLPTSGHARRSAGLSVYSFLRPQQIVEYDRTGLQRVVEKLDTFAKAEGLPGHGEAAGIRFKD